MSYHVTAQATVTANQASTTPGLVNDPAELTSGTSQADRNIAH